MSIIVIKYGGSLLEEPGHRSAFLKDVAALSKEQQLILVHGGGKEISRQMEQAGLKPNFVNGRRYTDDATMVVVKKALAGLNAEIVAELESLGVKAFGRSGQDEHLLLAEPVAELGRVGMPRKVNAEVLTLSLRQDEMPVYYSIGEDIDQQPLNINADDFALALAISCRAARLVYLTDTGGVLDAQGQLIPKITPKDVETLGRKKVISGGMLVKAKACVEALKKASGASTLSKESVIF